MNDLARSRTGAALRLAALFLAGGALSLGAAGCATYSARIADLRPQLAGGDFAGALATVEDNTGGKDRLLYHLERGTVLHYADRYAESNEAFALSEQLADDLYTKSVSEGALSLITNDGSISYRARPFEMAMVPYFKALNYIGLGEPAEALVEARRAGEVQARYVEATLAAVREEDRGDLARLRADPFLLYWSGLLYEWGRETNNAFIAYRNAAVAYQELSGLLEVEIPAALAGDLIRTGTRLGFGSELAELRGSCPDVFAAAPDTAVGDRDETGEVVLMIESGYVPQKEQVRFDFPVFVSEDYRDHDSWAWEYYGSRGNFQGMAGGRKIEYWISVAAPELKDDRPEVVGGCRVSAGIAGSHAAGVKVANLAREARITFDAEKPSIFFKTILRGLTKYLASRQAKKSGGAVAGVLTNLFGAAIEKADTRSWLTLPESIRMVRLSLPPGTYDLEVEILDSRGHPFHTDRLPGVTVSAGGWTFLSRRVF
ncbi:MAG: hypothetical protein ABIK96_04300 [bacterium]